MEPSVPPPEIPTAQYGALRTAGFTALLDTIAGQARETALLRAYVAELEAERDALRAQPADRED